MLAHNFLHPSSQFSQRRMVSKQKQLFLSSALILLSMLCLVGGCKKSKRIVTPDISNIQGNLKIIGAEQLLEASSEEAFRADWDLFYRAHPAFSVFLRDWIYQSEPGIEDPVGRMYELFVSPDRMRDLADSVSNVFSTQTDWEKTLNDAYRYHSHYFPYDTLSNVYTYSGMFGQPVDMTPDFTAVALTMFMGRDFSAYKSIPSENLPRYLIHRLEPQYIPVKVMDAVARTKWQANLSDNSVLNFMLYEGKLLYYLDQVLPFVPDSIKIGYTSAQLDWVRYNQEDAWALIVTEDLLYSSKSSDIARLTGEGPNTKGMSFESPSRVGIWMAWQIVRSYMKKNPDKTLQDLFSETDNQFLLQAAKWKPKNGSF